VCHFSFQLLKSRKTNGNEKLICEVVGSKQIKFYKGRDTVYDQHSFFSSHYGLVISVSSASHQTACIISFLPDITQFSLYIAQEIRNEWNITLIVLQSGLTSRNVAQMLL
jgi:hypothetical protein